MLELINERLTKLKSLYNVLDLMNNNIISKQEKEKLIKDIKEILKELDGLLI